MNPTIDTAKIDRYRSQSLRWLESGEEELRSGRWNRAEELLWGSISLAVKGAALSAGTELTDDQAVRAYAQKIGDEYRDRRVRGAFEQLGKLSAALERARESRRRADGVLRALDDISGAVEMLWDLVDANLYQWEA